MMKTNFAAVAALLALAATGSVAPAEAAGISFDPTTVSGLSALHVADIIRTMASGGDYRSYSGASTSSVTGIDMGIDLTGIWAPASFQTAMGVITGTSSAQIPALLPFPRFNARKGLPFGLEVGLSFIPSGLIPGYSIQTWGGELKWNLLNKNLAPQVAFRASANYGSLWFIDTHAFKFELVGSKKFGPVEPYVSAGYQLWNGTLNLSSTLQQALALTGVSSQASDSNLVLGGGVSIKLVFLKLVAEYDYNATGAGVQTVGGRAVFSF